MSCYANISANYTEMLPSLAGQANGERYGWYM
jgi:hypothetical protein